MNNIIICDAKKCISGKHIGAGNYICDHYNLLTQYPELVVEWDPINGRMEDYHPGSGKNVSWICTKNPCGCHKYLSIIKNRVRPTCKGCPYCFNNKPCPHNNLSTVYPHLIGQWYEGNDKSISEYSHKSGVSVWWVCKHNVCGCHIWQAKIASVTNSKSKTTGCPYCDGKKVCVHNNLETKYPHLKEEWDPINGPMSEYAPHSGDIVSWVCFSNKLCNCHKWDTRINDRTKENPTDCPYCCNQKVCDHNNLEILYPHLRKEWNSKNKTLMKEYAPHSSEKVWWVCPKNICGCHEWIASIDNRTRETETGCPYCSSKLLCCHNNLEALHPELIKEWHPNNIKPMNEYFPSSNDIVWWICSKNNTHIWETSPNNRTRPSSCPKCSKNKGYSEKQIIWMTEIENIENIVIQHACKAEGEFKIQGIGKVDGYCKENNTVYEYHGDYWHGNPIIYDPNEINPTNKISYGELYNKTILRDESIKKLGFNLIVKWET